MPYQIAKQFMDIIGGHIYVEYRSLWLDLVILWRTMEGVLSGEGVDAIL